MHYDKPPISFQQQVEKLKTRGMQFKSESTAIQHLSNISIIGYELIHIYGIVDSQHT